MPAAHMHAPMGGAPRWWTTACTCTCPWGARHGGGRRHARSPCAMCICMCTGDEHAAAGRNRDAPSLLVVQRAAQRGLRQRPRGSARRRATVRRGRSVGWHAARRVPRWERSEWRRRADTQRAPWRRERRPRPAQVLPPARSSSTPRVPFLACIPPAPLPWSSHRCSQWPA